MFLGASSGSGGIQQGILKKRMFEIKDKLSGVRNNDLLFQEGALEGSKAIHIDNVMDA